MRELRHLADGLSVCQGSIGHLRSSLLKPQCAIRYTSMKNHDALVTRIPSRNFHHAKPVSAPLDPRGERQDNSLHLSPLPIHDRNQTLHVMFFCDIRPPLSTRMRPHICAYMSPPLPQRPLSFSRSPNTHFSPLLRWLDPHLHQVTPNPLSSLIPSSHPILVLLVIRSPFPFEYATDGL